MKLKSVLCCVMASAMMMLSFAGCEKESEEPLMNTETSRVVMDNFINQEQYSVKVVYKGMNYEFYYVKDGENEFLGSTIGSLQSRVIRLGDRTYYFDAVGSGKMRRVDNDTSDINLAVQMLDTIYKQTVVDGKLIRSVPIGEGVTKVTYDDYEYYDDEKDETIQWTLAIREDMLVQAVRKSDNRIFNFEYPEFEEAVFNLPEDYVLVDDNGNVLETDSEGNILGTAEAAETAVEETAESSVEETQVSE